MAKRRPTTPQIRARAVKIVKYQLTTGKTDAQVAKDLGIKSSTVRTLKAGNFKRIRRSYNRSTDYQKAYSAAGNVRGAGATRVNEIRLIRTPTTRRQRTYERARNITISERDREIRAATYIERYYVSPENTRESSDLAQASNWADWTSDYQLESGATLPTSIADIREMYEEGLINDEEYSEIVDEWKAMYGIQSSS